MISAVELPTTRDGCEAWDAADPVSAFFDRFVVPDPGLVYLDGNSLGRLPKATVERLRHVVVEEWGRGLVGSWDRWIDDSRRVGDLIGTLLGAEPGETLVADSTTVNLFKLVSAACGDRPGAIVVADNEFPTDRYVAAAVAEALGRATAPSLEAADGPIAVVVRSAVDYRTGAIADIASGSRAAHDRGALALWDCSHAVGAIALHLRRDGADLAAGCSYKHLCGGPGAPAWLWVRAGLQAGLRQPIRGWFGQRDQFSMDAAWDPLEGVGSWASGTPPILALAAVEEGVRLVIEAGIEAVERRVRALGDLAIARFDEELAPLGCTLASPREAEARGAHIAVRHPAAGPVTLALRERGVVPDLRPPDVVRLGLAALSTRAVDVWDGIAAMADVLRVEAWRAHEGVTARVT
jgi:kynureninase